MKLKNIQEEIIIQATPEKLWTVLSQFGDVSNFHAGVVKSVRVDGSENTASLGCERVCNIVDMGLKIVLKERIINFVEGEGYQFEVYEWKNFPLQKMLFAFKILAGPQANSILRIDIDYRTKPAFLTGIMSGKMRKLVKNVLLGYKHYAETGQKRVPLETIKKKYKNQVLPALQQA